MAQHPDGERAITGGADGQLRVWDLRTGALLASREGHEGRVCTISISSDGRRAVSGGDDCRLVAWDLQDLRQVSRMTGHNGSVTHVNLSRDGFCAVSVSATTSTGDPTMRVWDTRTGSMTAELPGHRLCTDSFALHPDGRRLISRGADRSVKIWELLEGGSPTTLTPPSDGALRPRHEPDYGLPEWLQDDAERPAALCVDPSGELLMVGHHHGAVRIWNLLTSELIRTLHGHEDRVGAVAFHPGGRHLVTASHDRSLRVWEHDSDRCVASWEADGALTTAACTTTGHIVTGSAGGEVIFLALEAGPTSP